MADNQSPSLNLKVSILMFVTDFLFKGVDNLRRGRPNTQFSAGDNFGDICDTAMKYLQQGLGMI